MGRWVGEHTKDSDEVGWWVGRAYLEVIHVDVERMVDARGERLCQVGFRKLPFF